MLPLLFGFAVGAATAAVVARRHPQSSPGQRILAGLGAGALAGAGTAALQDAVASADNELDDQPFLDWLEFDPPTRLFISHHHADEGPLKEALAELAESGELGLDYEDRSVRRRIRSRDPSRIRADLTRRVRHETDVLVVLAGQKTAERPYVRHEVDQALAVAKPVVVVKTHRSARVPDSLYGKGAHWSSINNLDGVATALARAARDS